MASYKLPQGPIVASSEGIDSRGNIVPRQLYADHINGVLQKVSKAATQTLRFYRGPVAVAAMQGSVEDAAWLHDLGKLMEPFQLAMKDLGPMSERGNHVHAGVRFLLDSFENKQRVKKENYSRILSAILIEGHHIGLLKKDKAIKRLNGSVLSNFAFLSQTHGTTPGTRNHASTPSYVKDCLEDMMNKHNELIKRKLSNAKIYLEDMETIDVRILFSILTDSDHLDASSRFSKYQLDDFEEIDLNPKARLVFLKSHVKAKGKEELKKSGKNRKTRRNVIRDQLFNECLNCDPNKPFYILSASVGSGKTLASAALALRIAKSQNLRRIYHVSPFINTTSQTADVLRAALSLASDQKDTDPVHKDHNPGERSVAEHHHVAIYDNWVAASFGKLWKSPIICVTAVQFFQTLFSEEPHRVRKLHQLPGSVIILDEFDNSFPPHLWPIIAKTLRVLNERWGCVFILCSGTPIRPWESEQLNMEPLNIHEVVQTRLREKMRNMERGRVVISRLTHSNSSVFSGSQLLTRIACFSGPRLCILQTMRNAALLAHHAKRLGVAPENDIYHISSALSKADRSRILEKIKQRLKNKDPIIVFATSILETGIDISFRHAFIEARSVTACLQVSGRVNRHGEYNKYTRGVYCFILDPLADQQNYPFTSNKDFFPSTSHLLDKMIGGQITTDNCQEAFNNLVQNHVKNDLLISINEANTKWDMGELSKLTKIIEDDYVAVMVDPALFRIIMTNSLGNMTSGQLSIAIEAACVSVPFHSMNGWVSSEDDDDRPVRPGKYNFVSLGELIEDGELTHRSSVRYHNNPDRLNLWNGLYDPNFYGYMIQELVRLGIADGEGYTNPADGLSDLEESFEFHTDSPNSVR